ncbi:hypothetical protein EC54115_25589 [Escherichia coli 541-15]|nr:hypothetical protein EC54115_25589 [Escherichia coli 541-15]
MKRTEITAIIQENTQQQSIEIQNLLNQSSESLKRTIQQQLKEEQIKIEKDIKSHRIRTYNKIEKLLKEKIQILNISMLQTILILLSLNLFCSLMIMIRIVIRG